LGHSHSHHPTATGWVLKASLIATLAFTAFEVWAGFRSNSLSLLSDAAHNFTDAFALLLALIGFYVQSKPADHLRTFGYHRAGVVTAFINAATLVLISLSIFYEAVIRLLHPEPVNDTIMFWVALAALVLNGGIMLGLNSGKKDDINLRAAFVHMLGDAIGAGAIIIGAVIIRYSHWTYIDPILSLALGGLILYSAWDIIRESLNILLEGLPRGLELPKVTEAMSGVEGVLDVHDLHVWSIGSNTHALCSHVLIDDMPPSESDAILKRINTKLCSIGIHHSTIQFEHVPCVMREQPCRMGTDHVHEHDHRAHGHSHNH
jgi:cobalt-zinc-cadmium efflux system protein